jgi:hypothetical protein
MLEVQKLYNAAKGDRVVFLEALANIGVEARDYPELKMLLLDYNQIECIKDHPVVIECRGIIMGYDGQVIRKGFNRFFNLGECGVDRFDFENSVTFEKADGSLCFIYWCEPTGRWEMGSRGTAFAEGPANFYPTFRDFFLNCMSRTEEEFQRDCNEFLEKDTTYLNEGCGPDNRIVTPYIKNELVYLGAIHNVTGIELPYNGDSFCDMMPWNVRPIRQYSFNTQEDCIIALGELTGLQEGYVVYNKKTGGRVKIKNAVYLAAHRLRGNGLTINSVCELVVMGEVAEYVSTFPEDAPKFEPAEKKLAEILFNINYAYGQYAGIEDQKEFALLVKDLPFSGIMFKARKDKTTTTHTFNSMPVARRAEWLKESLGSLV